MNYGNRHEVLKAHYRAELLRDFDWSAVYAEAKSNPCWDEGGGISGLAYLGSSLHPSGKIYAFWTTNQTRSDETRDAAWNEALEETATEHGLSIRWSDVDTFAAIYLGEGDDAVVEHDGNFYCFGSVVADTEQGLRDWMDSEQYWPNVFTESDHGNLSFYRFETPRPKGRG